MRRGRILSQGMQRMLTRRAMMLGGLQGVFVGVLAYRMRHLQVEQAGQFKLMADQNSVKIRLIPPARGLIHDHKGVLVAGNEQNYRVTVTREDAKDVKEDKR